MPMEKYGVVAEDGKEKVAHDKAQANIERLKKNNNAGRLVVDKLVEEMKRGTKQEE